MASKGKTNIISQIVSVILAIGALLGVCAAISFFLEKEEETSERLWLSFERGSLTDYGQYQEDDTSLYTKEMFDCQGLEVELDFENNISYQIFFYNANGNFLSATELLSKSYLAEELPEGATQARIVISPNWGEYVEEKEKKIQFYEIWKYTTQLTIKVEK